jgi:hypothetical protein
MDWKSLIIGVVLIVVLGVGGLVYRNVVERSGKPVACPVDALVCPDGTSVAREGLSCTFPACPPPNTTVDELGIAFAIPQGFAAGSAAGGQSVREYTAPATSSSTLAARITLSRFAIASSSNVLETIKESAIGDPSGLPVPESRYTSTSIADRQYTVVEIGRFEGVVDTAYYLVRQDRGDVLRFDAIDYSADWMNPALDVAALPAHAALLKLLNTLQGT